ncbi:MAG: hypothetical protein ACE15E_23615 [Acidobacteriota bacterium]
MRPKLRYLPAMFAMLLPSVSLYADSEQEQRSERTRVRPQYEIKLTIHFLNDGKRTNHKDYSIILGNDQGGKIRTLKKVPVEREVGKVDYLETGVKCDTRYEIKDGSLQLYVELIMSGLSPGEHGSDANAPLDEIQCRAVANIIPSRPTVVARLDGTAGNTGYEIEVLATPVTAQQ